MTRLATALVALFVIAIVAACGSPSGQSSGASTGDSQKEVVVFAAASLAESLGEMSDGYAAENDGARPRYNFAGSNQLRAQIEQGARADVFASANEQEVDALVRAGLVVGEPRLFARNHLVVVLPATNPGRLQTLGDLGKPGLRLVLAAPGVPVGGYSLELLEKMSRDPAYGTGFKERVLSNVISQETDVKQVVAKIQLGEADAGIVYSSDVTSGVSASVRTLEVPDAFNVIAQYPIAVISDGRQTALGQKFVEHVLSPAGQAALRSHGFLPVN